MPRFVVLVHDWPERHFDLLLEAGGELRSWKLPAEFSPSARSPILPGPSHRLIYLDYEGVVSGGRGTVKRWDGGEYAWITVAKAHFFGERLTGVYEWLKELEGCWTFGSVT